MNINVPTSWDSVTVNQYQALSQINKANYDTDLKYTIALLQALCDIDKVIDLPLTFITEVAPLTAFLSTPPPTDRVDSINIDGEVFKWIGSFNELTVGEALSIEQIIDLEELDYNLSYDVVAAVLLRKEGEVFNSNEFHKRRELFGNLPITDVIGTILFFLNGGQLYTRGMQTYSITELTGTTIQKKNYRLKRILNRLKRTLTNGWLLLTNFRAAIQLMTNQLTR